jgi:hypothetical protein
MQDKPLSNMALASSPMVIEWPDRHFSATGVVVDRGG